MWKKILIGIVVIIAVLLVVVVLQPASFSVERSTAIAAPPSAIFPLVNDFHQWDRWSPWAKRDPEMKTTYSGADAGVGATYAWVGNSEVGEGKMTITESAPNERIVINLEFLVPFKATNTTEFTFTPVGDQTEVRWRMTGENGFVGKAMSLFMDMDSMVGGDFEDGLQSMKAAAEGV